MFFISEVSPLFFILSLVWLTLGLGIRAFSDINNINIFLMTLYGFFLNVIMGAMYQLIPNSLMKKPILPKFSFGVFGFSLLNIFVSLLWFFGFLENIYFAFSTAFLMLIFVVHVSTALKKPNSITPKFLSASLIFMLINAFILVLWAFNKVNIFFLIHTFTLGVILNAIIGVELALVPLLYMEPFNMSHANKLFYLHQISVLGLLVSFYYENLNFVYIAGIFEFFTVGFFIYIVYKSMENRKFPKNIPYTLRYFFLGLGFLMIGIVFGLLASRGYLNPFLHADIMIYAFGATTVFGGIFHFMPRILWNKYYKDKIGTPNIPPIDSMIDQDIVKKVLPMIGASSLLQIVFETYDYLHPIGDILQLLVVLFGLYALKRK